MSQLILTERLALHLIEAGELISLYENPGSDAMYPEKPFTNPHKVLIDDPGPLKWRVPQVKTDPRLNIWFVRWVVLRATDEIIGSISFHGEPDQDGMIEIGLGIHPDFRNNGYGQEALLAMWTWVIDQPGVTVLRYTVAAQNAPSLAIISNFGFHHVGQQLDPDDGPEEIYEMSVAEFRSQRGSPESAPR